MLDPRPWQLALVALGVAAVGWLALARAVAAGAVLPVVPVAVLVVLVVLAVALLAAAVPVRRWKRGVRARVRRLDPVRAARTAVAGVSAAWVGAALTGWYAAQALVVLPFLEGARLTRFTHAAIAALLAAVLAVVGSIVRAWCALPPEDDDDPDPDDAV